MNYGKRKCDRCLVHTMEYYSVMRKKQTLIFATIQMNTEGIMLREMLDNERHIMHGFPYLFNLNH